VIGAKAGSTEYILLKSGVNRDFNPTQWDKIKDISVVKDLLSLGAITVQEDVEVVETSVKATGGLSTMPVKEALDTIDATFDLDLLKEWDFAENRIRIKNAIAKRVKAITEGEG
jgi:hypothetical protein